MDEMVGRGALVAISSATQRRPQNSGAAGPICWPNCRRSRSARRRNRWRRILFRRLAEPRARNFSTRHAETVYRKLTKNLGAFVRVDELVYDAAKLVPGLTPTRKQVEAESALMQGEKDGVEVDQGIFLAQVLAVPDAGMHLCHAMLAAENGSDRAHRRVYQERRDRFRPGAGGAARQGGGGHHLQSAFSQCRGRRHARRYRDRSRHRHPRSDERNLRAARRRGRASEICRAAKSFPPASISLISIAGKFPISGTSGATWAWSTRCCAAWPWAAPAPTKSMAARARSRGSPASMFSPSAAAANISL